MVFAPISFRWLKEEKMARVKVVCLKVLYHPSNFLPSLKYIENKSWYIGQTSWYILQTFLVNDEQVYKIPKRTSYFYVIFFTIIYRVLHLKRTVFSESI